MEVKLPAQKGTLTYFNQLEAILENTNLVEIMDRKAIMNRFSQFIDNDPIVTHKDAFDTLIVWQCDPVNRLKLDKEFRNRFVNMYNVV